MRRTLDGVLLDSLLLWAFVALLTLFAYEIWGTTIVQNHYYFTTTPYSYMGTRVP